MEIKIAETCGLCGGCQRAFDIVIQKLQEGNNVTIFKEIVHNKNFNTILRAYGAVTKENLQDLTSEELVILRGHGEPPKTYEYLNNNQISYVDCTCPNVENIHKAVEKYSGMGYDIVLLGKHKEKMHPEVEGIVGWVLTNTYLVQDQEDVDKLKNVKDKKLYLVCQTTFNMFLAEELIADIEKIAKQNNCEIVINKSLCSAQREINKSSQALAKQVDFMIVIGGKNSSNSKELFNNVSGICPSIFIEDIYEYKNALQNANITIKDDSVIGITAGASTMKNELLALQKLIEKDYRNKTEKK